VHLLRLAIAGLFAASTLAAQKPVGPRFEIAFASAAHPDAITGRVYVALSRTSTAQNTPIQQTGETGVPLFGVNVEGLAAGKAAVIDASTFGFPARSLKDIPAGEYWVQPFVNVYTKFARADGHTVWLHMDQWEGPELEALAGKHLRRSGEGKVRPNVLNADQARGRQGHSAGRRATRD